MAGTMAATIWVSDREPGIRLLFGELIPEALVLTPEALVERLRAGDEPDALVVDGTQLLELPAARRRRLLGLPRVLICTGVPLTSLPMHLIAGPGVAVLAKPFCVDDLESAIAWLREAAPAPDQPSLAAVAARGARRARSPRAAH